MSCFKDMHNPEKIASVAAGAACVRLRSSRKQGTGGEAVKRGRLI